MRIDKFLYLIVHLVIPLVIFITHFLFDYFSSSNLTLSNINNNLSIIAIYYFVASLLWFINIKSISKVIEEQKNVDKRKNK